MTADSVSNEELLQDIQTTIREKAAYSELQDGFSVLSELPENYGSQALRYRTEQQKYADMEKGCGEFLNKLLNIKKERGL
jgi:hypothetical protein